MIWVGKPGGMCAVDVDLPHLGDGGLLSSCGHMAAALLKKNKACKLVKISRSESDRGDHDEAGKGDYAVLENQKFEKGSERFEEKSGKPGEEEGREEREDQRPLCLERKMGKKSSAEGRNVSEEKIPRGSEDARSSSDESDTSGVSWQVVRKRKRRGKQERKTLKNTDGNRVGSTKEV